jgi:aspartate dehydrogenase
MTAVLRVALGGFGTVGGEVARVLDAGIEGLTLVAVSARDRQAARQRMAGYRQPVPVLGLRELAAHAEVIVECAPAACFEEVAEPALDGGRTFIPVSVGQLLAHPDYEARARRAGGRIIVPSGALLGLDAVRAAAEGTIHSVRMITRKPPRALAGAPLVLERGLDMAKVEAPLLLFRGSAREAIRGFPANINVAVALSLAGIGPDRTMVEIWADPGVDRNTHRIEVDADSARLELFIANIPSARNPGTGRITALSAIAALRGLVAPMRIG